MIAGLFRDVAVSTVAHCLTWHPVGTQRLVSMPVAGKGLRSLVKQGGEEAKRDHSVMIFDV